MHSALSWRPDRSDAHRPSSSCAGTAAAPSGTHQPRLPSLKEEKKRTTKTRKNDVPRRAHTPCLSSIFGVHPSGRPPSFSRSCDPDRGTPDFRTRANEAAAAVPCSPLPFLPFLRRRRRRKHTVGAPLGGGSFVRIAD